MTSPAAPERNTPAALLCWTEDGQAREARWLCAGDSRPPSRIVVVDDQLRADAAYRHACSGTAMLWRGDYHNARQLLAALTRRHAAAASKTPKRQKRPQQDSPDPVPQDPRSLFNRYRLAQSQRAHLLGTLLIPMEPDYRIALRRAPDVREACEAAWGPLHAPAVLSLRSLLGVIGAHEWRQRGVFIDALQARIHPHYGVFSPVRGEYLQLLAEAPLPEAAHTLALDIGTGTGVLAALLCQRGVQRVLATDLDPRALACASDNLQRLGLQARVSLQQTDLFPAETRAALVVCNPPWLPARPTTPIEQAVYDPDSRMLRGFLQGLGKHLTADGEGWLILSDLAERLGLRTRTELLEWIDAGGLSVIDRLDTRPVHRKAHDDTDPLHQARRDEITSLWRLRLSRPEHRAR